jgi:hypothetical protein
MASRPSSRCGDTCAHTQRVAAATHREPNALLPRQYTLDEDDKPIKITRKVKVIKKTARVSRSVIARRAWKKFGDCEGSRAA